MLKRQINDFMFVLQGFELLFEMVHWFLLLCLVVARKYYPILTSTVNGVFCKSYSTGFTTLYFQSEKIFSTSSKQYVKSVAV